MPRRLVVIAVLLASCARPAAAQVVTWRVEGNTRQALVFAPSTATTGPKLPVVFAFHGRGDEVQNFQFIHLHVAWRDAIVVYFQGLGRDGLSGWQTERGQDSDRDLKLVDVALASLRQKYKVDDDRVYATGFSNGAGFTYFLWAERPEVFAAYAVVAGRLRPSVQPKQPRPLLAIAGERDPQITFPDQKAAMTTAIAVNGVRGSTTRCGAGCTSYGADTSAPVVTVIHPGGHEYPRGTSERIVAFFREHARADGGQIMRYRSEYGADLPARVYGVERGAERDSMTVVDYRLCLLEYLSGSAAHARRPGWRRRSEPRRRCPVNG